MLASIALIIVLMINSVKKQARGKMRKLESKLAELTGQRKLNISRKEKLRNRLVAADASEQALIHLWLERDEPAYELIHFNKVKKCEIIKLSNRITEKSSFTQTFTRFSDFDATQILQNVENQLIDDIGTQLADDIFNKAFVNW